MGHRWTQADVDALKAKGLREKGAAPKPPSAPQKREPKAFSEMKGWLRVLSIPFEEEYRFHPTRRYRFDIALPQLMLGVEYEGLISEKSRHTTIAGYTEDATKYNLAQLCGWRVLRYTAKNYNDFLKDITSILHPQIIGPDGRQPRGRAQDRGDVPVPAAAV